MMKLAHLLSSFSMAWKELKTSELPSQLCTFSTTYFQVVMLENHALWYQEWHRTALSMTKTFEGLQCIQILITKPFTLISTLHATTLLEIKWPFICLLVLVIGWKKHMLHWLLRRLCRKNEIHYLYLNCERPVHNMPWKSRKTMIQGQNPRPSPMRWMPFLHKIAAATLMKHNALILFLGWL
jgi:hypothetical protein